MAKDNVVQLKKPEPFTDDPITEILRVGARKLLAEALEAEIEDFLSQYKDLKDDRNHQRVVRNGYLPEREIQSGIGLGPPAASRLRAYSVYLFLAAPLSEENQEHGRFDPVALFKRYLDQ